jgi:tetratricopeptide (TPR) repeat protein
VLKSNPKNVRALVESARIYSAQPAQLAKAFELAKSAYKLAPEDPQIGLMFGRLAYASGEYKLALNLLQEAARQLPGDPEVSFDLGQADYSGGLVTEAVAQLQKALQSGPGFSHAAKAREFLSLIAIAAKPTPDASAQVEQGLKSDPTFAPALMAQGAIFEQKGDARGAIQSYEKVLGQYPDFVPAKRQLTILYAQGGGNDKNASDIGIKALQAFPDDAQLAKALGIIDYRLGDFASSERFLKQSAPKLGGDGQLLYYLGMDQYQLKQSGDSKKSLTQALMLKLDDKQAGEAKRVLGELK